MEIDCIIHGTWIKLDTQGWFVVWGEERSAEMRKPKGRLPKVPAHPYAVSSDAIQNCLREIAESLTLDFDPNMPVGEAVFSLPSAGKIPVPSYSMLTGDEEIGLSDHKINTTYLSAFDAVQLLSSIPLHAYDLPYEIGEDIRFWSAAAKFALYIISQHKFLPMLRKDDEGFMAIWEPSLDDPSDIEKIVIV